MTKSGEQAGWEEETQELRERRRLVRARDNDEAVQRHHAQGKFTIHERLERLLDAGSFQEFGTLAGTPIYADGILTGYRPDGFVAGIGEIDGRRVVAGGEDYTARGGQPVGARIGSKSAFAERMAAEWRLPMIRLIDAFGASIRGMEGMGRTYIPDNPGFSAMVQLTGLVPVVGAVLGSVAGLPAAKAVASHWTVMVKGQSQIFPAGPPVVRRALGIEIHKEDLGGYKVHAMKSGVIDNVAEDEADCLLQIRRFLSYLPSNVWQEPPRRESDDDPNRREEELIRIIPRNRNRVYDARRMLRLIVDRDSFFEIAPFFGRSLITGFARFNGYPVAVLANDVTHIGGSLDAEASEKLMRFVDLADLFHLPVVNFVDQPGFMVGPASEAAGTIRKGTRALYAIEQSSVPWLAVIVRKCYGVAGGGYMRHSGLELIYAWPSAEWGSLPIEGGVDAAYRREIELAADPEAHRRAIEARLTALRSPLPTAEAFGVPEIIDPRETRPLICRFVAIAQEVIRHQLGPKQQTGIRP